MALKMYRQAEKANNSFTLYQLSLMSESGIIQEINLTRHAVITKKQRKGEIRKHN